MSQSGVLNPTLYSFLVRTFGAVKIRKQGVPMAARVRVELVRGSARKSLKIDEPGETYCVSCPLCPDTNGHLYIAHQYGLRNKETGQVNKYARCFKCDKAPHTILSQAYEQCHMIGSRLPEPVVMPTVSTGSSWPEYKEPGRCVMLGSGAASAVPDAYLEYREIDVRRAADDYQWRYCVEGNPDVYYGACKGRIIIPVFLNGKEVGWQARLSFDPVTDKKKKKEKGFHNLRWLSMPGAGWIARAVVGFDQAKHSSFCVVVEGPTDMIKHGSPFVGTLGQSVSEAQIDLIVGQWGREGGGIIVLGDPGKKEGAVSFSTASRLARKSQAPVYNIRMQDGDPGDWDTGDLCRFIAERIAIIRKGGSMNE
jgi:hypothetical protein